MNVQEEPEGVLFQDTANSVEPGAGCERVDDHRARYRFATAPLGISAARYTKVDAGDGDDVVVASPHGGVSIAGGAGNDALTGGSGGDLMTGGTGSDRVLGGDGRDQIAEEDDVAAADVDSYDGGPDVDSIDYAKRRARVVVDPADGAGDRADLLADVVAVTGGSGADRIRGDDGDNSLIGAQGGDRLSGRAAQDALTGGEGRDRLESESGNDTLEGDAGMFLVKAARDHFSGGDGDDTIHSDDTIREQVSCGTGRDAVSTSLAPSTPLRRWDVLLADCEQTGSVSAPLFGATSRTLIDAQPLRVGARLVVLRGQCRRCRATVKLLGGARTIGVGRVKSGRMRVRVPLRSRLRLGQGVRVGIHWRLRTKVPLQSLCSLRLGRAEAGPWAMRRTARITDPAGVASGGGQETFGP